MPMRDSGGSPEGPGKAHPPGGIAAGVSKLPNWARHALQEKGLLRLEDLRRARQKRLEKSWLPNGPNPSHVRSSSRTPANPGLAAAPITPTLQTPPLSGKPRARSISRTPQMRTRTQSQCRSVSKTPPFRPTSFTPATPPLASRPVSYNVPPMGPAAVHARSPVTPIRQAKRASQPPPRLKKPSVSLPAPSLQPSLSPQNSSSQPLAPMHSFMALRTPRRGQPSIYEESSSTRDDSRDSGGATRELEVRSEDAPGSSVSEMSKLGEERGGVMEDVLIQQVATLMSERQEWGLQKQQLTKEIEQLHELIGYLLEQDASETEGRGLSRAGSALAEGLEASRGTSRVPSRGPSSRDGGLLHRESSRGSLRSSPSRTSLAVQ